MSDETKWHPTMGLRWKVFSTACTTTTSTAALSNCAGVGTIAVSNLGRMETINFLPIHANTPAQSILPSSVLQQQWINDAGEQEWRDVQYEFGGSNER